MKEKRKYPRYDQAFDVRYCTGGIASFESTSSTKNVSKTGVRLSISRLLKSGDTLRLMLFPPDDVNAPVQALGKVVWTREAGQFDLDAGVQFTKIAENDANRLVVARATAS